MSTATIYAHRFDAPNDELTGVIGGGEPDAPGYWRMSIEIALAWERELAAACTPATRKLALRCAMVMSTTPGTVFPTLSGLVRLGLGGPIAGGRQYVSWIHEADFVRAVLFLLERDDLEGAVNIAAPESLPHREMMRTLRATQHMPLGLPATWRMMEIAAFVHGTDAELILKSRRIVPRRLLEAGFTFEFPDFRHAAEELASRHARAAA
jgi:NAD dependent epimerase/dehydratase family enzyme